MANFPYLTKEEAQERKEAFEEELGNRADSYAIFAHRLILKPWYTFGWGTRRFLEVPEEKKEQVNHPEHYNVHPSGVECIDIVEGFSFNIGNAVKYLWRAGLKGAAEEDLRKAIWYIEREIKRNGEINSKEDS